MTKEAYLEAAERRYDELDRLNLIADFYDYETEFIKIWQDLGREVLEKNISICWFKRPRMDHKLFHRCSTGLSGVNPTGRRMSYDLIEMKSKL